MGHHYITEVPEEKYVFNKRSKLITVVLVLVGLVLMTIGSMQAQKNWGKSHSTEKIENEHKDADHHSYHQNDDWESNALKIHPVSVSSEDEHKADESHVTGHHEKKWTSRLWANLLMNSYYFFLFACGALFFWAVNYVANAGWGTLVKRVYESMTAYLPIGALILMVSVFLGHKEIYHWVQYFAENLSVGDTGFDRILNEKKWLLNNKTLFIAVPLIIVVWYLFRFFLRKYSLLEDNHNDTNEKKFFTKSVRTSAGFIAFFAFSFSFLSWIVIMSIDAHWFSTMFSVYNFALMFVTSLTVLTFFVIYLKSKGYLTMVNDEHLDDLAKYMFAFTVFWGYIFLSQFLLIWYANIPEESMYFDARWTGYFYPLFISKIILSFLLPFLILMSRYAKRNPWIVLLGGSLILIGHWIDTYLLVMPGIVGENSNIGFLEIGTTLVFAGIFIFVVLNSLSKASLYPKKHPYLLESVNHEVGP